ncbi:MAG TPA: response regulator transcription factor [Acidimicrobiales bacterium]|jgi:DNA-binding NarL/FixJ family response regulator|nr:response regulator transcription factor [Acidimicrobiales bacterium]
MSLTIRDQLSVRVIAPDAITRDGLIAQLRSRPGVTVAEDPQDYVSVSVVVADEVDSWVLQAIRRARAEGPAKVVLVAARLDEKAVFEAVEAGIGSVLWRSRASIETIVDAARATAEGHGVLPPDLIGRLLDQVGAIQRDVLIPRGLGYSGLSTREADVLRLVADGMDSAEVARELFCSERTVKTIIHDVTNRLNLRNRTHAVAYALRQGLI